MYGKYWPDSTFYNITYVWGEGEVLVVDTCGDAGHATLVSLHLPVSPLVTGVQTKMWTLDAAKCTST